MYINFIIISIIIDIIIYYCVINYWDYFVIMFFYWYGYFDIIGIIGIIVYINFS
jgi:hypothetical protein